MNHYWSLSFRGYCCFYRRTPAPTISRTSSTLSNSLPSLSPVLTEVSSMSQLSPRNADALCSPLCRQTCQSQHSHCLRLLCAHRERPIHHHQRPNRYHDMLLPYPVRIFPSHLLTGAHTPKAVVTPEIQSHPVSQNSRSELCPIIELGVNFDLGLNFDPHQHFQLHLHQHRQHPQHSQLLQQQQH